MINYSLWISRDPRVVDAMRRAHEARAAEWHRALVVLARALAYPWRRARSLLAALRRRRLALRTLRELEALDDRLLRDIGIHRGRIAELANELAAGGTASVAHRGLAPAPRDVQPGEPRGCEVIALQSPPRPAPAGATDLARRPAATGREAA